MELNIKKLRKDFKGGKLKKLKVSGVKTKVRKTGKIKYENLF